MIMVLFSVTHSSNNLKNSNWKTVTVETNSAQTRFVSTPNISYSIKIHPGTDLPTMQKMFNIRDLVTASSHTRKLHL